MSKFDGRLVLTNGPFTWDAHGVATRTSKNWFFNHKFKEAYEESWSEIEKFKLTQTKREGQIDSIKHFIKRENYKNELNVYLAGALAHHCLKLEGDLPSNRTRAGYKALKRKGEKP